MFANLAAYQNPKEYYQFPSYPLNQYKAGSQVMLML